MYAKILQRLLQRFFMTMGRAPISAAEWSKLRRQAIELARKEGGDPITGKPFPGWNPKVIEGGKSKKGIEGLMKSGDVQLGKAPKTLPETLQRKKAGLEGQINKEKWIARKKQENKDAIRRFKQKNPKTVEDFRDKGDWDPSGMAGGGIAPLVGEPSYAANFYDDRTPMAGGLLVKLLKKLKSKPKSNKLSEQDVVALKKKHGLDPESAKKDEEAFNLRLQQILAKHSTKHAEGGRIGLFGGGKALKVWKKFVEKLFKEEMTKPTFRNLNPKNKEWAKRQVENYNKKLPGITKKYEEFKKTGKLPEDMHVDDIFQKEHGISNNEYFRGYDTKKLRKKEVDYDYYREILDDAENDFVQGDETLETLEGMVKEQQDYHAYMYDQYKTGKLEPKAGEHSRGRLELLRERADSAYGDPKMFTHDDYDELEYLEDYFKQLDKEEAFLKAEEIAKAKKSPLQREVSERTGKVFDIKTEQYVTPGKGVDERTALKTKYPGISDDLLNKILIDDNPQRKADVLSTVDQYMKLQEVGKSEAEAYDIITKSFSKNPTKHAEGGRADFIFGGSAGLKAMWKQMMKGISERRGGEPVKRLFPGLSARDKAMEKVVIGTPEQKAFREGEVTHKIEGIDILINRLKHDKKILERQAKNKAMKDEGLDFLMKDLEKSMSDVYGPHLKKYTDIDKDILQMENIKKNLIMKDRKLNAYGGRIGYAGGGKTGLPAVTMGTPQGPAMQQPQMPVGPQPAGIPGGTIVAQNQMQQAPWMGSQMQQGLGGMPRPQRGMPRPQRGMPRPMAAGGGRIGLKHGSNLKVWGKDIDEQWPNLNEDQKNWIRENFPDAIHEKSEGGRIGFGLGGIDKARRAFLKMMAAVGGAGIAAGTGLLKLGKAAKVVPKVTETIVQSNAEGLPLWFGPLVKRVIKEGDDISQRAATVERQTVHRATLPESGTPVEVTRDLVTDDIIVDIGIGKHGWRDGFHGQPTRLELKKGEWIEPTKTKKGIKTKDEFTVEEAEFTGGHPENIKFEESSIEKFGEHGSNFDEVEKFATGTIKKKTGKASIKAERQHWTPEDDFASGGLARMLGE
jgi:hypothetical protein